MNRHACRKRFTLASKLALVGGLLILLNPCLTIAFWLPRSPGIFVSMDEWLALAFWNVGQIVCGVAIMICSRLLKSKPKHSVALGATIVVFSLLYPSSNVLASYPHSIDILLGGLHLFLIMYLGNVLGVIGGFCAIFGWKSDLETIELSKEDYEELTKKEYEKLTEEEKHMKEEYEQLMEED